MQDMTLESIAAESPIGACLGRRFSEVLSLCRHECHAVEMAECGFQHAILTRAEKKLSPRQEKPGLVGVLANSVLWRYHVTMFKNNIEVFKKSNWAVWAKFFDLQYYAGTHNYFAMRQGFEQNFCDAFKEEAILHYKGALDCWADVEKTREDWWYRYVDKSWACLRLGQLSERTDRLMTDGISALSRATDKLDCKNRKKELNNFIKCMNVWLAMINHIRGDYLKYSADVSAVKQRLYKKLEGKDV